MSTTKLDHVLLFRQRQLIEPNGNLIPIEFDKTIPFKPKRTFFVCNVPDHEPRGKHAHFKTKQVLICLNGRIDVKLHDGISEGSYTLLSGDSIYIPNMIWDEQVYHTPETVLISLCSTHYDTNDYIHSFNEFLTLK
jgi:dTDP-4-dehydrorhamnose 3,5-epimerase-like enzyme